MQRRVCIKTILHPQLAKGGRPQFVRDFLRFALASAGFGLFSVIPALAQTAAQTPAVTVDHSPSSITTAQSLSATIHVNGTSGSPTPTGTVVLTSGSYSLPPNIPFTMPALTGIYRSSLGTANLSANSGLSNATVTYVDSSGAAQGTASGVVAATA